MKKSILIIASIAIVFLTVSFKGNEKCSLTISTQTTKWYNYAYAYNTTLKVMYVSELVSMENEGLPSGSHGLINEWNDYMRTLVEDYYNWKNDSYTWTHKESTRKSRIKKIGDYKKRGYEIKYAKDFRYNH